MRSTSIKSVASVVSTVAIAATLTLTAPVARAARVAQPRETIQQREEPRGAIDRAAKAVKRLVSRLTGGIGSNNWPLPPLP